MAWQDTLIRLYLYICHHYQSHLHLLAHRLSNNNQPTFTDEEVLTIYLFGIIKQHRTIKAIYTYVTDHMAPWFPALPSYGGYIQRLNRLHELFPRLVEEILNDFVPEGVLNQVRLVDSMPIVMAHEKRSSQAKVAPEIANKGYCASKRMYFYGVKVHLVAFRRPGTLPVPDYMGLSAGAANDLSVLRSLVPRLHDCEVYGDKIYADAEVARRLERDQNVRLYRPIKKKKGQKELVLTDRVYSEIVSGVRQPIESFFNWVQEKTGIEVASKVRSYKGLKVHVFGRLAAALFLLAFNP
jgi:hypothetical protein